MLWSRRLNNSHVAGRRGAALVELAIVISLLLILVFGLIDFGLMIKDYLALSQLAREAARSAAVGSSVSTVNTRISTWSNNLGLDSSQISAAMQYTDPTTGGTSGLADAGEFNNAPAGSEISVSLTYPHALIAGGLLALPDSIQLNTTMVMRRE